MSERAAKILWYALLAMIFALTYMAGPLGFILGALVMWVVCESLRQFGALPPRDPE